MQTFRTALLVLAVAVNGAAASPDTARAGDRLDLTLSGEPAGGLAVRQAAGAAYEMTESRLTVQLALQAAVRADASGYRITGSSLALRGAGGAQGSEVQFPITPGARSISNTQDVEFAVDPLGAVAQSAKAACASAPGAGETVMRVPVVWRVTTGRFAFANLAREGLQPAEDMLANAAYYSERASEEAETALSVAITCEGAEAAAAVASFEPAPPRLKHEAKGTAAPAKARAIPEKKMARAEPALEKNEPEKTGSEQKEQPVCDGGMLRQTSTTAEPVCLCPGNTTRRETSAGRFVCEKRFAKRR